MLWGDGMGYEGNVLAFGPSFDPSNLLPCLSYWHYHFQFPVKKPSQTFRVRFCDVRIRRAQFLQRLEGPLCYGLRSIWVNHELTLSHFFYSLFLQHNFSYVSFRLQLWYHSLRTLLFPPETELGARLIAFIAQGSNSWSAHLLSFPHSVMT